MAGPSLIAEGMNRGGAGSVHIFVGQVRVVEMVADGNGTPDHEVGEHLKGGRLAGRCGTICQAVSIVKWFTDRQLVTGSDFFVFLRHRQFGYKIRVCKLHGGIGLTGDEEQFIRSVKCTTARKVNVPRRQRLDAGLDAEECICRQSAGHLSDNWQIDA